MNDMKDEEIRKRIAETLGWVWNETRNRFGAENRAKWLNPKGEQSGYWKPSEYAAAWTDVFPPDYPKDLNAMHEAENTLDWSQKERFRSRLANKFHDLDDENWNLAYAKAIHATARQRAEAFLRTLGLWEEDEKS